MKRKLFILFGFLIWMMSCDLMNQAEEELKDEEKIEQPEEGKTTVTSDDFTKLKNGEPITIDVNGEDLTLTIKQPAGGAEPVLEIIDANGKQTIYAPENINTLSIEGVWRAVKQIEDNETRTLKVDDANFMEVIITAKDDGSFKVETRTEGKPEYISKKEEPEDTTTFVEYVPPLQVCGELTPEQKIIGDSLVSKANIKGINAIEDFVTAIDNGSWEEAQLMAPHRALEFYDQALEAAPNHCEAHFGRTLAEFAMIIEDPELDAFVNHVEDYINHMDSVNSSEPMAKLKVVTTPDKAPVTLMKVAKAVAEVDPVTVQEIQDLAENVFLPKIDAVIESLSEVMGKENLAFEFVVERGTPDEETIQIDQGEVGPMLAAAKVAKAFLIVIIAVEADQAMIDGSADWIEELMNMDDEDFDNLTTAQREALDQLTGLTDANSTVTSIKDEWEQKYQSIPDLLLEAITDVQAGLAYGINEAKSGSQSQKNDPYVVGTGINADVDPADLQEVIDDLERFKKYLTGTPVEIRYNNGQNKLNVNLRQFFHMKNIQSYLPHHDFLPYEDWNDIAGTDRHWTDFPWEYSDAYGEVLENLGYSRDDQGIWPSNMNGVMSIYAPETQGSFADLIAEVTQDPETCDFSFKKIAERVLSGNNRFYQSEILDSALEGTFTLQKCQTFNNGDVEFLDWEDEYTKIPFFFTDASGSTTLDLNDEHPDFEDVRYFTGKVIFPDPTFGGIFPDLTNDNIWKTVNRIVETVEPKIMWACREWDMNTAETVNVTVTNKERNNDERYFEDCDAINPGMDASDLDRLIYRMED